ncbi:YncE family protein [Romboutsia maritimum]|uniref:YncE family protein n=1 Tax=Romboutsia maritimum TaxID=2020948 RepID=A0A371IVC2_9FIRM|nr:YncE family protein [Romboutsia maritimum]RDY24411.1 YncE family protein [Romboutsia maritimum]
MKVYISNYLSKSISIVDYSTFKLEKEIQLGDNIYPHHFCIDKESKMIYIPSSSNGILYVLDLEKNKIIDNVSIGGNLSQIVLCNNELFISNEDSNSIYILDKINLCPIGIISVDNMPHGFDFDENVNKLYVPCINSIVCIDVISKCIDKKIDTNFKAWHIKIDKMKKEIYTSTLDGKLVILDEETMDIKRIIEEFLLPVEICFNYKYRKIYITDLGYKNIRILDYNTLKYLGNIEVDGIPQGLEISKNEDLLFVSDTQRNSFKVYDVKSNKLIKEIRVGKEPTTIICM